MTRGLLGALAITTLAWQAFGAPIVNDTWIDGTRDDPSAANGYSEFGVDADLDGNIESRWFKGPSATTVTMVNGNPGVTPGIMRTLVNAGGSSSLTTYFAPVATPVTLASAGNQIKVTWVFTPIGVNSTNGGQGLRLGLMDWPEATLPRLSTDINPPSTPLAVYPGYAMFMNMNTTLANSAPFQLLERSAAATTFLANAAGWTSVADQEDSGITGYADNTEYTFLFSATRNGLGELELAASMTGGNIGGDGSLNAVFTDATPNTFTFDVFGIRPSSAGETFNQFDTSLFKVEFFEAIPEPSVLALLGAGAAGLLRWRRREPR